MAFKLAMFSFAWTGLLYLTVASSPKTEIHKISNLNKTDHFTGILSLTVKKPFIVFMDNTEIFHVEYSVQCKVIDQTFFIIIKSYDEKVMSVREQSVVSVSCQNATDFLQISTINHGITTTNGSTEQLAVSQISTNSDIQKSLNGNLTITLYGELIGRTLIGIGIKENISKSRLHDDNSAEIRVFPVTVFRRRKVIDTIFRVIIYFFLIYSSLGFGCKLDLKTVKKNLKKPVAPAIGFGCQYVFMPLIAFGIAKSVTKYSSAISLGIFVAGCCPGGGISNIYAYLLDGDLSLSITMTTLSSLAAIAMLPLWVYTLGNEFVEDSNIKIPFLNIFTTLLMLTVPIIVGVFIKFKLPKIAKGIVKTMTPITVIAITILLTVGIYSNLYIYKLFNPRVVLAGCLLPYCGYILSMIFSIILRRPWVITKTIAIETGIQNNGIAMIIMLFAFPPPDGEIAAIGPIASATMTPIPLFFITIVYLIYKKCCKKKYETVETEKNDAKNANDVPLEKCNGKEKFKKGQGDDVENGLIQK